LRVRGEGANPRRPLPGCTGHRNCANCLTYALQWRTRVLAAAQLHHAPTNPHSSNGRPHERHPARITIGTGPETIRVIKQALRDRVLPDTYVSAGTLVHIEQVSGDLTTAADEDSPLPVAASPMNPAGLAGLLAEHAFVYRMTVFGQLSQGFGLLAEADGNRTRPAQILGHTGVEDREGHQPPERLRRSP
jgi:hypothetical protein